MRKSRRSNTGSRSPAARCTWWTSSWMRGPSSCRRRCRCSMKTRSTPSRRGSSKRSIGSTAKPFGSCLEATIARKAGGLSPQRPRPSCPNWPVSADVLETVTGRSRSWRSADDGITKAMNESIQAKVQGNLVLTPELQRAMSAGVQTAARLCSAASHCTLRLDEIEQQIEQTSPIEGVWMPHFRLLESLQELRVEAQHRHVEMSEMLAQLREQLEIA